MWAHGRGLLRRSLLLKPGPAHEDAWASKNLRSRLVHTHLLAQRNASQRLPARPQAVAQREVLGSHGGKVHG